jgi:Spy/CpxP family protein refolding chaperone
MLKFIATVAASAAALAAVSMTPATAAPKAQPAEETVMFAPGQGMDVVEHRHRRHFKFYSAGFYGYGYPSCYWGWRYGKKVWICY